MLNRVLSLKTLKQITHQEYLHVVASQNLTPLENAEKHLKIWQENNFAGEMLYMQKDPSIYSSPLKHLSKGQSVILLAALYDIDPLPELRPGFGRVARYAWGLDYHKVLKEKSLRIVARVEKLLGCNITYKVYSDAVPLLERALAEREGLGFQGKNTMLIQSRGVGSFFFLAEIIWDVVIEADFEQPKLRVIKDTTNTEKENCGTCSRCMNACPTGAIVSEYQVDARKCISYLSIEKRGILNIEERKALGEWVFGCDICQEVCPFNYTALKTGEAGTWNLVPEFHASNGVGPFLDLGALLKLRTKEEFMARFGHTPLTRAKREGLLRNAAIVVANTMACNLVPELIQAFKEDSSPVVREHALWALSELEHRGNAVGKGKMRELVKEGTLP